MNTQYQLCFYSGSLTGKIFPIVKEETKIGRDASCDIVLTENSISRIHVFLYVQQNGSVVLVDNNSTNGTVVNNYQISAPVQLSENDVIGLGGDVMLVFQRVAGYDPGIQLNGTDMPAGNAPDSYNFEKKQGNPMSNENNNLPNDGAANGSVSNKSQDQQQGTENFGFNQTYNAPNGMPGMNQGQAPNGYPHNIFTPYDPSGASAQMPMQPAVPSDNAAQPGTPVSTDGASPVSNETANSQVPGASQTSPIYQQPMSFSNDPFAQQMGQQMPYAANSYGQPMPFGNNPYGQPMPFSQPPMGQQPNAFGVDPYSQQQPMGQQVPYSNDPYGQPMGQQMPYGNNPYGQPMGQQMPFGNNPYAQPMGQQMPYGNDPYGQQPVMGQQMPYGNNPYAQQPGMGQQFSGTLNNQDEEKPKKKRKKTIITLGVILGVLILIGIFIFYVDHNRLWCDVFPFLWDADTCANYMR